MELAMSGAMKRGRDLQPGSLARASFRDENYLLLVGEPAGMGATLYGLLPLDGSDPSFVVLNESFDCLDYGDACVVEPILGAESKPGNAALEGEPGVLHIGPAGARITFGSRKGVNGEEMHISITDGTNSYIDRTYWPVLNYRIWASEADRMNPRAIPLYERKAKEQ